MVRTIKEMFTYHVCLIINYFIYEPFFNVTAVQHERGPRNSTLRRQMALYLKEPEMMSNLVRPTNVSVAAAAAALDLALPKSTMESRVSAANNVPPPHHHPHSHPMYAHGNMNMNMCKVRMVRGIFQFVHLSRFSF